MEGTVVGIYLAQAGALPMAGAAEVRAVEGMGLEGDRYHSRTGTFSTRHDSSWEVTLIEVEAVEALRRDYGVELEPGQARRNLVTRGVALNHLVGSEFTVGEVRLRGIRLCEPCGHLARLSHPKVEAGLVHRGGLRAQILQGGTIRVGDPVRAG